MICRLKKGVIVEMARLTRRGLRKAQRLHNCRNAQFTCRKSKLEELNNLNHDTMFYAALRGRRKPNGRMQESNSLLLEKGNKQWKCKKLAFFGSEGTRDMSIT